jgi:hypothetical protein
MTGALAGIGLGVAVLAVTLPSGGLSVDDAPGPVAGAIRQTVPDDERTDIVPPVVRTLTIGSTSSLPSGGTP